METFDGHKENPLSVPENSSTSNAARTTEPTPSIFIDFLVHQAKNANTPEDHRRLWHAVFSLSVWQCVARGQMPKLYPFIGVVSGRPLLHVFTDTQKAYAFAKQQGFTDASGNAQLMSLPVPGFIESLNFYKEQGVSGVHFNSGPDGFIAPIEALTAAYEAYRQGI